MYLPEEEMSTCIVHYAIFSVLGLALRACLSLIFSNVDILLCEALTQSV